MSGSLATTSIRKPSGSLNAAALRSGVIGFGASVGCGICPSACRLRKIVETSSRDFITRAVLSVVVEE
jgi:heterodisulfide reductase subunit C